METPQIAKRRRRKHVLRIVEDIRQGRVRFKLPGYYLHGKRARKFFEPRGEAERFAEAEQVKRETLGTRATHINGALAEDAVRAAELLKPHALTVFDAARLAADSIVKLAPFNASVRDAVGFYVEMMQKRQ